MSGALRFFGVATLIGAVIAASAIWLDGNLTVVNQLLIVACVVGGAFWMVVLLAFANMYDWMSRLADHFDVRDPD